MTNLIIHQGFRYFCFLYYLTYFLLTEQFYYASFSYFLLFLIFFTGPVDNENVRLRLALAIPTRVPITVAIDAVEMLPLFSYGLNYSFH